MEQNLEDLYSEKHLILASYLGLSKDQLDEIEESTDDEYIYEGEKYLVYTETQTDDIISDLIEDKISDVQWDIDNKIDLYEQYDNGSFMYLSVDKDAIEDYINNEFGYYIGNGNNDYGIYGSYYIFKN